MHLKEVLLNLTNTEKYKKLLNKVSMHKGEYKVKDEGNTALSIEMANIVSIDILDSGAGISIVTKAIWHKWGKACSLKHTNEPTIGQWKLRKSNWRA